MNEGAAVAKQHVVSQKMVTQNKRAHIKNKPPTLNHTQRKKIYQEAARYAEDAHAIDTHKEATYARFFSTYIAYASAREKKHIMQLAQRMRLKMASIYPPHIQKEAQACGSLGVALFLNPERDMQIPHQSPHSAEHPSRSSPTNRHPINILVREAWLFSRAARAFIAMMIEEGISHACHAANTSLARTSLKQNSSANTQKKERPRSDRLERETGLKHVRLFCEEAMGLGRLEEMHYAGLCALHGLGGEKDVKEGIRRLIKSERYGAKRHLFAHAYKTKQHSKALNYWKAITHNARTRRKRYYARGHNTLSS